MTDRRVTFENEDTEALLEEIHLACEKGTIEEVRNVFNRYRHLQDFYYEGFSPLHTALESGRDDLAELIDVLVENGIDVNGATDTAKDTALHQAVENGDFPQNYDIIVKLVEHKADPYIRNKSLRTPYDCALARGYDLIAATLDGSKTTTEVENTYRERMGEKHAPDLNRAVLESDEDAIKVYIKKGAYGAGAIHYAVSRCELPVLHVLELLVGAGADVDIRDDEGDSALNLAIKSESLRKDGKMIPVVKFLLDQGADISLRDLDGKNALDLAKDRRYNDVVKVLTKGREAQLRRAVMDALEDTRENDGDVNKPNNNNNNDMKPIGEEDIEEESEKSDEENDSEQNKNMSNDRMEKQNTENRGKLVTHKSDNNHDDPEEEIIDNNDGDVKSEDGLYPIHQAILKEDAGERMSLLKTLVEAGADVNAAVRGESEENENEDNTETVNVGSEAIQLGTTALHLAADKGQADSVKFLLENGADKTKKTLVGKTAFNMASDKNHREVMELLGDREDMVKDKWKKGAKKSSTCTIL